MDQEMENKIHKIDKLMGEKKKKVLKKSKTNKLNSDKNKKETDQKKKDKD